MKNNISHLIVITIFSSLLLACSTTRQADNDQQEVMTALTNFVQAFENGDLATMEASFAVDATDFPRAVMSNNNSSSIQNSDYKRVVGIDPQMRRLISMWSANNDEPPYISLDPLDLEVKMFSDAALVTFHLIDGDALSRRSFVFSKREGEWKIVHLHASNVVSSQ